MMPVVTAPVFSNAVKRYGVRKEEVGILGAEDDGAAGRYVHGGIRSEDAHDVLDGDGDAAAGAGAVTADEELVPLDVLEPVHLLHHISPLRSCQ